MNEKKKGFNLFPEYVWMIFVGMLLAILFLTNVLPAKAWTEDEEYVIIDDWLNDRLIKVTSDDDGNVFHPGVPTVKAVSEFVNGHWSPLPANNYLPNNFSVNGNLASCVLAPPSSWADDDHYRVIQPSWEAIYSIGIPAISVFDDEYFAYFEGGDGLIYAVVSDKPIYLKNKDSRGSFGVYSILPDPDASSTVIYQWTGSWNRFGYTSFSDTSVSDRIAISTLFYGKLYWEDFEYTETVLGVPVTMKTDNYALYNGTLPRLDILSSSFDAPVDIPVDPDPGYLFHFIFQTDRKLLSSSDNTGYYCVEVSGVYNPSFSVSESSAAYSYAYRLHNVVNPYITPVFCYGWSSDNVNAYAFYFGGSSISYNVYYSSSPFASTDIEFIRSNFTAISSSSFALYSSGDLSAITCRLSGYDNFNGYFFSSISGFKTYGFQTINSTDPFYETGLRDTSNLVGYPLVRAYIYGLTGASGDPVGPSPTPTVAPTLSPEPTPSATPIPSPGGTIYIVTPVPPTPPIGFQPYDPGSVEFPALGVQQFENITDQLPDRVNNTTAAASLGFLGFLMGFLPAEALWFLWFLLFILVVLAIVRLFIHFTGG